MSVLAQAAARGDILIRRGVTTEWGIRWEHSTDGRTFTPMNLTGWAGALQLRSPLGEVWLTRPVMCDTSGLTTATLTPDDVADPIWASRAGGEWLINLTSPDGRAERLGDGYFHLEA